MSRYLYTFEDLSDSDLPRPPLSATRALRLAGVALSQSGWLSMPMERRRELARAGAEDVVPLNVVRAFVDAAPVREVRLTPAVADPSAAEVPPELANAFGPSQAITAELWRALRPIDRYVLAVIQGNTRLLLRALREMALNVPKPPVGLASLAWTGTLARSEVRMEPSLLVKLQTPRVLEGRALLLAKVAGIRAARWASEILDLCAAKPTGPLEVGHSFGDTIPGVVIWQAHASTVEGEFSPGASLLAVATAAAALSDIVEREGGKATIQAGRLADEAWRRAEFDEDLTLLHR